MSKKPVKLSMHKEESKKGFIVQTKPGAKKDRDGYNVINYVQLSYSPRAGKYYSLTDDRKRAYIFNTEDDAQHYIDKGVKKGDGNDFLEIVNA